MASILEIVDDVIVHLLPQRDKKPGVIVPLPEQHIIFICRHMQQVFASEPPLLRLHAPLTICGDTHGQFADLMRIFEYDKDGGYPPNTRYLFLGDYVDRGRWSIEVICLLFALKIRYPDNVYLLRGNHEDASLNRVYGFYDECKRKYNVKLWKTFVDVFNWMPVAAIVDDRILCMHGGLSPDMDDYNQIDSVERPSKIPESGIMCDLLWSDPEKDISSLSGWAPNDRGISWIFSERVVKDFVKNNDLDLVCRAHMVVEDGYEFFADMRLVTIFSAPNYDNSFTNSGAMLCVDKNLICTIKILEPKRKVKSKRVP